MGAGVFQMPADASVLEDEKLRETFETYWSVPGQPAERAHEAAQSRLGPARFRFRRPAHAVREVLCRAGLRDEQLQLSRPGRGTSGRGRWTNCSQATTRPRAMPEKIVGDPRCHDAVMRASRVLVRVPALCHAFATAVAGRKMHNKPRSAPACRGAQGRIWNAQDTEHSAFGDQCGCGPRRAMAALSAPAPAQAQAQDLVMKLRRATHQRHAARVAEALRRGGREGFRRPHQGRDLSRKPARPDPAADRRRAVRLDPGLDGAAGIPGRRRRSLRGAERAGPVLQHRSGR